MFAYLVFVCLCFFVQCLCFFVVVLLRVFFVFVLCVCVFVYNVFEFLRVRVFVVLYVQAPTGKSKEELYKLLFDRAARRNRTDPYEEKKYRGAGIKKVQAWWKQC